MPDPLEEFNELRRKQGQRPLTDEEFGLPPTTPPSRQGVLSGEELKSFNELRGTQGQRPLTPEEFGGTTQAEGGERAPAGVDAGLAALNERRARVGQPALGPDPRLPRQPKPGEGREALNNALMASLLGAAVGGPLGAVGAGAGSFLVPPEDLSSMFAAGPLAGVRLGPRVLGRASRGLPTDLPVPREVPPFSDEPMGRVVRKLVDLERAGTPGEKARAQTELAAARIARQEGLSRPSITSTPPAGMGFGGFQSLADELGGTAETAGTPGRGLLERAASGAAGAIGLTLPKSWSDARRGLKSAAGLDLSELKGQIQELPGGPVMKGARIFGELTGETLRAGLASGDVTSAVLRQGFIETPAHPIRAAASFKTALSTLLSQENFDKLTVLRKSNLRYDDYVRTGALKQLGVGGAEDVDEFYKSLLASKLPVIGPMIKASNRVFAAYINEMGWRGMDDVIRGREKVGALTERAVLEKKATDLGFDTLDALRQASNKVTMGQRVSKSGQVLDVLAKDGIEWTDEIQDVADLEQARFVDIQAWGTAMNHMLGRGGLPVIKYQGRQVSTASFFNHAFFAPGLTASYAQIPIDLATNIFRPESRWVVGEMAKDLGKAVAVGASVMAVLKMSRRKDVKIVDDPLRADFGAVQMGTQRFNIWAGYQPIVRTAYQWRLNERLYSGTDIPYHPGRINIAWQFIRSKLHPRYNLAAQYAPVLFGETPKTYNGDPIEASFGGVTKEIREHMASLFWQDLADALGNEGLMGLTALVGNFGLGSQSYEANVEKYWRSVGGKGELRDQHLVTQEQILKNYWKARPPKEQLFRQPGSRLEANQKRPWGFR